MISWEKIIRHCHSTVILVAGNGSEMTKIHDEQNCFEFDDLDFMEDKQCRFQGNWSGSSARWI